MAEALATAGALILIALICISISRKIEAERRELGRFPRHRLPLVIGGSHRGAVSLRTRCCRNPSMNTGSGTIFCRQKMEPDPRIHRMAGRIPQSFIDDLTARADIVELIGSRVELKKAGREYRACCPFHNEKTPSFWVSPAKQFYHCFGCGAHGTALGFLMEYDKLSFPEAIEELAGRLGLDVPREAGGQPDNAGSTDAALRHEPARSRSTSRACCRTTRARRSTRRSAASRARPSTNS